MNTAFNQLLVHVHESGRSSVRLGIACQLAHQHGAAPTALYAAMPSFVERPHTPPVNRSLAAGMLAIDHAD